MAMLILNNLCSQLVVMKFGGKVMAFILQTMRKYLKPTNYLTLVILATKHWFPLETSVLMCFITPSVSVVDTLSMRLQSLLL